jgi:hypothetical protein
LKKNAKIDIIRTNKSREISKMYTVLNPQEQIQNRLLTFGEASKEYGVEVTYLIKSMSHLASILKKDGLKATMNLLDYAFVQKTRNPKEIRFIPTEETDYELAINELSRELESAALSNIRCNKSLSSLKNYLFNKETKNQYKKDKETYAFIERHKSSGDAFETMLKEENPEVVFKDEDVVMNFPNLDIMSLNLYSVAPNLRGVLGKEYAKLNHYKPKYINFNKVNKLNSEITVTFIEKKTKKEAIVKFKKEINSSSWEMKVKNPDNELFSLDKKELKNSFESMKEKIDAL